MPTFSHASHDTFALTCENHQGINTPNASNAPHSFDGSHSALLATKTRGPEWPRRFQIEGLLGQVSRSRLDATSQTLLELSVQPQLLRRLSALQEISAAHPFLVEEAW